MENILEHSYRSVRVFKNSVKSHLINVYLKNAFFYFCVY
jgi:hypothetical protein